LPYFNENSLIHPEAEEGGWVPAASVPDLALPFMAQPSASLPSQPSLRELVVLSGLLEKTQRLEEELRAVRADFVRRDEELSRLKARLDVCAWKSDEVQRSLEGAAVRLESSAGIREEVSELRRAERERSAVMKHLQDSVDALTTKLGSLAAASHPEEISDLRARLSLLEEKMDLRTAKALNPAAVQGLSPREEERRAPETVPPEAQPQIPEGEAPPFLPEGEVPPFIPS